jgi:hypothetical protein
MANDDLMIEVFENSTLAVSDGVREGIKEWAKEHVKAWFKSVVFQTFTIACGSSLAGTFALSIGKRLVSKWRAMAEKRADPKIVDGIRYAELVLNDYGDPLDDNKESRKTRADMLRNAIDHLYDAYAAADRLKEEGLTKRIKFLMGLCGLMLNDVHTCMLHLDPFIEDAVAMKRGFETEATDGATMYAEASALEMRVAELAAVDQGIKNAFALYGPTPFHCEREGNPWTGSGPDPLDKTIDSHIKRNKIPAKRNGLVEKLVIFLVLKEYRDKKILECETFIRGCESRTIHRSLRPGLGRRRSIV